MDYNYTMEKNKIVSLTMEKNQGILYIPSGHVGSKWQ